MLAPTAGCGVHGLSFRQDHRVDIVSPSDRSTVTLPFDLTWTVDDFDVTGPTDRPHPGSGYFAVLIDRAPPPPGDTIESLFRGDDSCLASEGCPSAERLADGYVFPTATTRLRIDRLPPVTADHRAFHELVIVLLDGAGHRIGESAFRVHVEHDRGAR
jgi:hypothetical protein